MPYLPIEDYGVIGNMRSAALVGRNGSIDWLCLPRFDSPSVFGAILDHQKAGRFAIDAVGDHATNSQMYWPDTNVLLTRLRSGDGVAEICDFMPVPAATEREPMPCLVRHVKVHSGPIQLRMRCQPAFDYARQRHELQLQDHEARFITPELSLALQSSAPVQRMSAQPRAQHDHLGDGVTCTIQFDTNDDASFVLYQLEKPDQEIPTLEERYPCLLRDEAVRYWHEWIKRCSFRGRWTDTVRRSALVLKLLTYEPTGAIIASPTCSLPEHIGGRRNWDYRYTWMRDAGYTIYAFLRIGFTQEAAAFMDWLHQRCHEVDAKTPLQPVYRIDGSSDLEEIELPHLEGYRGSGPVRIGNAASTQLQLDITGAVLDAAYLHNKHAMPLSDSLWNEMSEIVEWTINNWKRKDDGIWEVRDGRSHFVFSKVMCWVAIDRGVRLAEKRSFPADLLRWRKHRDEIYLDIMKHGWSEKRQAFVQSYGCEDLDAANLIMPLVFFIAANDPRMTKTLEAIRQPLGCGGLIEDFLVRRYDPRRTEDGVGGDEGAFNMCTFWLIEALTRAGKADRALIEDAETLFDRMRGAANHLGLFAEQTGKHREALGNYPQAFTHLSLISAAFNLHRMLEAESAD